MTILVHSMTTVIPLQTMIARTQLILKAMQLATHSQSEMDENTSQKPHLKKDLLVRFKTNENDESWFQAKLTSRAGKASGKYPNAWNVLSENGDASHADFDKVYKWEALTHTDEEDLVNEIHLTSMENEHYKAKMKELLSWKEQNVYVEMNDNGQKCVSVQWVIKPKYIEGKLSTKARLCARGFEEDTSFRTDSPISTREGICVVFSTIASMQWTIKAIDVKTAFLQ